MSLVDTYLSSRPGKTRPKGVLYATDLTKSCIRNAYLSIVDPLDYPVNTLRIFESGNMIESWWVDNVLSNNRDITVFGTQVPCYYMDDVVNIHGRLDALCQHRNGRIVGHEVKSIKSAYYVAQSGAKDEHVQQLQFYLNVLGVDLGQVDYLDKDVMLNGAEEADRVDYCFPQQRNPVVFAEMIVKARRLMKCLFDGEAPAEKGWLCDYCLYSEVCNE